MKKNHYSTMRRSILVSMILVPLIPLFFIVGTGYYYFTSYIENSNIINMKRIVEDHSQMIEEFLRERMADLELICSSYNFDEIARDEKTRQVFEHLQKSSNAFVDLGIFDGQGIHVAYYGPYQLGGREYGEADWFMQVMRQGFFISDVFLGYRKVPHFIIAVVKKEGSNSWVIRATIDTNMFNDLVKKVRIGRTGEAYILNQKGLFQTERRSGGNLMSEDPDHGENISFHEGTKSFIHENEMGIKFLYTTTWLKDGKWLLVVRQQKEDAFRTLRLASYMILIICIIGGGIVVLLAFYLTDKIVRRMEHKDHEKEQLNEQLIRASRLAELGEMSTGFAHEINNPLQIIKSEHTLITDILSEIAGQKGLSESEEFCEIEDSLAQIYLQVERCSEITQSILKFGRKSDFKAKDIDIREVISDVANMVKKKADINGISLTLEMDNGSRLIHGDPGQLQQVFLNLFNNAIDAIIDEHGVTGGSLDVRIMNGDNGEATIFIKDNGCGISTENQKNIFRPFFTTKPVGKGTGLGLSVCYGIVHGMGGKLEVESMEGKGSTFVIHLPGIEG